MDSLLDLPGKRITTFLGMKDLSRKAFTSISLPSNKLTSFEHFGTHPNLWELRLESNAITSFLGMTKQRSLETLALAGNPIASNPNYRLMALLTIGFSLKTIDGVKVDAQERETARRLGPNAALAVSYGWLLDLTPRSAAEYDEIIAEVRRERRVTKHSADAPATRTIAAVMSEEASKENMATGGGGQQGKQGLSAEASELQNKALVHLSNRVAQLERQLMMTELELAQERSARADSSHLHRIAAANTNTDTVEGMSLRDIRSTESIHFVGGIVLRTNVELTTQKPTKPEQSVCVVIDRDVVSFRHSFTRARIVDCPLSAIEDVQLDLQGHCVLVLASSGAVFDTHVTDEATLVAIYKLLFLRRGFMCPPRILRRIEPEKPKPAPSCTSSEPVPTLSPQPSASVPAANPTASLSAAAEKSDAEDRPDMPVEDCGPPLPAVAPAETAAPEASPPPHSSTSGNSPMRVTQQTSSSPPKQAPAKRPEPKQAVKTPPSRQAETHSKQPSRKQKSDAAASGLDTVSSDSSDDEIPVVAARNQRVAPAAVAMAAAVAPAQAVAAPATTAPKVPVPASTVASATENPEKEKAGDPAKRAWRGKLIKELLVDSDSDD
jgi:hypothetical protein